MVRARRIVLASSILTLVWGLLQYGSVYAEETPDVSHRELQQQVVEAYVAGKDVRPLVERLKAKKAPWAISPRPPRSEEAADFQKRLFAFHLALRRAVNNGDPAPDTITSLLASYESLQAAHLLLSERFKTVQRQLEDAQIPTAFEQRRQKAEEAYNKTMSQLFERLDGSLGAVQRADDRKVLLDDIAFRRNSLRSFQKALALLDKHTRSAPVTILRNNVLPFRQAKLAQRAPQVSPTIQPSYENPADAAPTLDDLAGTVDAPLTEEILQQAKDLDYDYIRIYEFVRNSIRTEWYPGAMKGAVGTLRQQAGNDVDQASLLIALFRASGLSARYVHGVIELPIEDVMSSLGLSDSNQATQALTRAGIAYKPIIRGGRVAVVEVEHTWVTAHVPYTNYRGAVVDVSGKTWLPLAPSLKKYDITPPTDILRTMNFSVDGGIDTYLQVEQTTDLLGVVRKAVTDFLQANSPDQTFEQQLGSSTLVTENIGLLPNTLPISVVAVTAESAELSDTHRQRIRFVARQGTLDGDPIILDFTVPLSEVASERVTLSYIPATVDDHKTSNQFGGLDAVPAYLIKLRPQIKINGRQKAVAQDAIDMGSLHRFEIHVLGPYGSERVDQSVIAGAYHGIGIGAQQVAQNIIEDDPADTEFQAAAILSQAALRYTDEWNRSETQLAGLLNVTIVRPLPTVTISSNATSVDIVLDRPFQLEWQGVTLDAALRISEPITRGTDTAAAKDWMRLSALQGSALEHQIFEQDFLVDSISADKGLRLARVGGIQVLTLDATNVDSLLPTLTHPDEVKADIENWVRLGLVVDVPRDPIIRNAWQGSVWRAEDPQTGAAGYFIAGALAGGATTEASGSWILQWLADALRAANTTPFNEDPLSGVTIIKVPGTDSQFGDAGMPLPLPLAVLVRDKGGRPVLGAEVVFQVVQGGGQLGIPGGDTVIVLTNELGIAAVSFTRGQRTDDSPIYVTRNPGDIFVTRAGENLVDAFMISRRGTLAIEQPFQSLGLPGEAINFSLTNFSPNSFEPGLWNDTITVAPVDQFGNVVSNVDVTFTAAGGAPASCEGVITFESPVVFGPCPVPSPVLGECGSPSLTGKGGPFGISVGIILGLGFQNYTVDMTAAGVAPLQITIGSAIPLPTGGRCPNPESTTTTSRTPFIGNQFGQNIQAAKAGERFETPIIVTYYRGNGTVGWERQTVEKVDIRVSNGGSSSGASLVGSSYETTITTGPAAAFNRVAIDALHTNSKGELSLSIRTINGVFGLEVRIHDVVSEGAEPGVIHINEDGFTAFPAEIQYTLLPADYPGGTVDVDFLEDGAFLRTVIGSNRAGGTGIAKVPRTTVFDANKTYEAQLVVNRGSPVEVKSDKFELKLRQKIFKNVSPFLRVSQDVDFLNERACTQGGSFDFTLTQDATVSLTFIDKQDPGRKVEFLTSQLLSKGDHSFLILPASDLPPGEYDFVLNGISQLDGHTDIERGTALSELEGRNSLPVGHVMVKGVDVFDGHLFVGSNDFSVPGRGAALEFRRSYSSNASAVPGPLGVGWTHNYDSKIVITPCAEVIVIGGEGSGMRFVDDGQGQGGLRPLKGYHGTLIANEQDRTFDFFSKDGTRYHYRNMGFAQGREWSLEFIEDNNGNVTRLGYDPRNREIAKLITVEDPARRTLGFTYEDKAFSKAGITDRTPVITKVEGPDGMAMSFAYDAFGNLTRAAREADAKVDVYTYTTDESLAFALRHKLLTQTNALNGATTTYTYIENPRTVVVPGVITFVAPYTSIQSIQDPEDPPLVRTEFAYNLVTRTTRVTDERDNVTTYTLNTYGSPLTIRDPVGPTSMTWSADDVLMESKTDANLVTTTFTYDDDGNVLTEVVDKNPALTTTFTYETFASRPIKNRVKTKTDRNGHTTTFSYDPKGNLVLVLDPENGRTEHGYAAKGDRVQTKDPNDNVTKFTYDTFGNLETVTDPLNGVTKTKWDERSRPIQVTDALQRVTDLKYDTLGRLTEKTNPLVIGGRGISKKQYDDANNKRTETDEEKRVTVFTHDKEGRLVRIDDPLGNFKTFGYDFVGNKTLETDWKGNPTTFDYDAANRLSARNEPLSKTTTFGYDPVGNVTSETDALNRLPTRHEYDVLNRRTKTIDSIGGITMFDYDDVGNKTFEQDERGRPTTFTYDKLDRLVTKTELLGRVTQFKYDPNGNRIEETDANGGIRKFKYDGLNRLTKRTDANQDTTVFEYDAVGNVKVEIDGRLNSTLHDYDGLNRRTKTTDPSRAVFEFRYDLVGNKTGETWPNGNQLTHTYDGLNRLTSTTDSLGPVVSFGYDANGNRTREKDANDNETTKTYDKLNRLTQVDMPELRQMTFGYDLVGNKTSETDPNGVSTMFVYDDLNRLTRVTDFFNNFMSFGYDAVDNKTSEIDKRGKPTTFEYDDLNRLTKTTDALTQFMMFGYDKVGNKTSETDKRGTVTGFEYDKENRLTKTTKANVPLSEIAYDEVGNKKFDTDANGNITAFIYDARNLLKTESRLLAAITNFKYDAMGDRIEERDPEGRITTFTYDLRRRQLTETVNGTETTTFTYDGNGNRTSQRRPNTNTWTMAYDGADRLISITDPLLGETSYTYDKNGNRLTQTDANNNTTSFEYDELNRQTAMILPDTARTGFGYDENGNRTSLIDPKGQVVGSTYDDLNRETLRTYQLPANPTGDDIQTIAFEYDENGNQTQITETFDGATGTRITIKTYDPFDRMRSVTDAFSETLQYAYDANGNRLSLTDPDGNTTSYTYDALNRASSVINAGGVSNYDYDRSSLKTKVTYPNGTTSQYRYDRARRTANITNKQGVAIVSQYDYTYDDNGNRTEQIETNGGAAETTTYVYDPTDRLTEVAYPNETTTYTYDPAYNRKTEQTVDNTTSTVTVNKVFTYDNRNQLATINDQLDPGNNVTYTYDTNGNQTSKTKGTVITDFIYDIRDQLRQVTQGGSTLGQFLYDYQGLRVQKDGDDGLLKYTYDDDSVLVQSNNSGQTVAKYDYGPDQLLSLNHSTEGRQFYLFDALGSAVNLTTPGGTLQARYQYDAWGNFRSQAGSSFNPFGFTGHERDDETGLYYFKARFYDPDTGRFLSQDPFLGEVNTPPSLHRYLYAYANPLFYIDLFGYQAQTLADEEKLKTEFDRTLDPQLDPEAREEAKKTLSEVLEEGKQARAAIRRREEEERRLTQESQTEPGTRTRRSIAEVCQGDVACETFELGKRAREEKRAKLAEETKERAKDTAIEAIIQFGPLATVDKGLKKTPAGRKKRKELKKKIREKAEKAIERAKEFVRKAKERFKRKGPKTKADDVAEGAGVASRGLRLPFKNEKRRKQVERVVDNFDKTGKPPSGVLQGGRKGARRGDFVNDKKRLPVKQPGYYRESDVWPGRKGSRGTERLVFGRDGEVYYSADHYRTFVKIR